MSKEIKKDVYDSMENVEFSKALESIWKFISRMNKYIDETMPWALAKDENKKERLARVMYNLIESLSKITFMVAPYMPESAEKMWKQLGLEGKVEDVKAVDIYNWGYIKNGMKTGKAEPVFPRIELESEIKQEIKKEEPKKEEEYITIDDFKKTKICVAEILEASPVEGADKLLKFKVKNVEAAWA